MKKFVESLPEDSELRGLLEKHNEDRSEPKGWSIERRINFLANVIEKRNPTPDQLGDSFMASNPYNNPEPGVCVARQFIDCFSSALWGKANLSEQDNEILAALWEKAQNSPQMKSNLFDYLDEKVFKDFN